MELKDFEELKIQEMQDVLRKPENAVFSQPSDLVIKTALVNNIVKLLDSQLKLDKLKEFMLTKEMFKNNFNLEGIGTPEHPFKIRCKYGEGTFYDARLLFNQEQYPNYIHQRKCHSNTYDFCRNYPHKCDAVIGICFKEKPFLHSVVKSKSLVLDFNYNLVMSADLYFNLFSFETLNTVNNEDIKANHSTFISKLANAKHPLTYADVLACYYELEEMFKKNTTNNIS